MLAARGMREVSTFADYAKLRDDPDAVIRAAQALGVEYVVCGWIPHEKGHFTEQNAREAADIFNRSGGQLKNAGLRLAFHLHGYEFQPYQNETLFDLLVKETRPELVGFELDVFWAVHGGADPVKLLRKHGSRFALMHIKDLRKGAQGDLTGSAPDDDSVPVGDGQVDWPAVLREAQRAGVKHYFIEDESVAAIYQIPRTLRYLETVSW